MAHQSQMAMQHGQQQQHQQQHAMMGMPQHMPMMMHMPATACSNNQPPPMDSKPGPSKKRKKPSRAQSAQAPQPMMKREPNMNTPPGMDPHRFGPMGGDPNATIVAQNPFDDFSDPCQMQPARMPPQNQQFMQGMPGHNPYGPPGQMSFPPGHQHMMMNNGGPKSMQQTPLSPMQMQHSMQMQPQHPGPPMSRQNVPDLSDKIVYPEERCMITNPQNPNAPPIYPCGFCHREVHENGPAIFCESGCNFWYHRECTGLSELAYKLLHSEVYAEWACEACINRPGHQVPLVKIKP